MKLSFIEHNAYEYFLYLQHNSITNVIRGRYYTNETTRKMCFVANYKLLSRFGETVFSNAIGEVFINNSYLIPRYTVRTLCREAVAPLSPVNRERITRYGDGSNNVARGACDKSRARYVFENRLRRGGRTGTILSYRRETSSFPRNNQRTCGVAPAAFRQQRMGVRTRARRL